MKFRSIAGLALAIFVSLWLPTPLCAGEWVPFEGRLEGAVTARAPVPPNSLALTVKCRGQALHLGQFTLLLPHTVNLADLSAAGTFCFSAADGDILYGEFNGNATPIAPGVVFIVESAVVKGGTGRFAGAGGSFTIERSFDSIGNYIVGSFRGVISTVGSNK